MADAFEREAIFKREADLVARNIRKISQNAKHIEKVSQYSKGSVDDLRKEHEVLHETKKLAEETKKKLEDMKTSLSQGTFQNQRQAKHQHEKLTDEFTSACTTLQSVQRDLVSKEKEQVRRVRAQSGTRPPGFTGSTDDQLIDLGRQPGAQVQVFMEEEMDIRILEEREAAIRQLEDDITNVNDIFKDLACMVHEQGEVIDTIEGNIDVGAARVEAGTQELAKASRYQTSARKKIFFICLLLLVVCLILGLVIYFSVKK